MNETTWKPHVAAGFFWGIGLALASPFIGAAWQVGAIIVQRLAQ